MNSEFSEIKDYAQLRARLDALSTEIQAASGKLSPRKSILLPIVRRLKAMMLGRMK